uniref:Uncharacterized protein n=1 Tax=Megaselia scalaris TaxID=36166 RepID=T1GPF9_MEGSC
MKHGFYKTQYPLFYNTIFLMVHLEGKTTEFLMIGICMESRTPIRNLPKESRTFFYQSSYYLSLSALSSSFNILLA